MIFFDNTNMQIPYLPFLDSNDLRQAGEQLNKIDFHRIGQNNWPEQFPYTPYAAFTMAHNGEMLFIRFKVDETGANFEETRLGHPWELTVGIPASALFRHNIDTWQGLKARINLYKCGDRLSCRHYLSWRPIDSPKPDFHTPRCFVAVQF